MTETMTRNGERVSSLDALLGRIMDLDSQKRDLVADTRAMTVRVESDEVPAANEIHLDVDGPGGIESFRLSDRAKTQMATDVGIPRRYFDRMRVDAPGLLVENAHYWMQNEPERRLVRGMGDTGRAWLSDRYRRLDHVEIARTLLPEFENLGEDITFHQAAVTDDHLYLRAVLPRIQGEVKVGEVVQWGVEIRNSETGCGSLSIGGFMLTLSCMNGMTMARDLNRRHVGKRIELDGILSDEAVMADDAAFWLATRDVLRATISETRFEEAIAQLREAAESTQIAKPMAATEVLQDRYSLSDDERDAVLGHLIQGGDLSRWGALSAVTRAAQDAESFDRQAELEELGWSLAAMPARDWDRVAVAR
jgi:hypothetical protein